MYRELSKQINQLLFQLHTMFSELSGIWPGLLLLLSSSGASNLHLIIKTIRILLNLDQPLEPLLMGTDFIHTFISIDLAGTTHHELLQH